MMIENWSFNIDFAELARKSTIYGLCTMFAVVVVLPSSYIIQHYLWPVLKFMGLKIRYFFHGY